MLEKMTTHARMHSDAKTLVLLNSIFLSLSSDFPKGLQKAIEGIGTPELGGSIDKKLHDFKHTGRDGRGNVELIGC
ncbi:hypothetical protein ACLOJK_014505 [Asimina triloba]